MKFRTLIFGLAVLCAQQAWADDFQTFWKTWGDGNAEVAGYRLVQPRYGATREGRAVLIYVTEDFSDSARVKADPGRHPAADVYPVMKLNHVRSFQTGIYDYRLMTSTFSRVSSGFPVAKISFTSQEWCGQVFHQLLPRDSKLESTSHSYFDGEADQRVDLPIPAGGIYEDQLPILVRGLAGPSFVGSGPEKGGGTQITVPFLRSLWSARGLHQKLAWGRATISVASEAVPVMAGGRKYMTIETQVAVDGGPTLTFDVEVSGSRRIVRWKSSEGDLLELMASERLPYWKLNAPGGETYLKKLGLSGR